LGGQVVGGRVGIGRVVGGRVVGGQVSVTPSKYTKLGIFGMHDWYANLQSGNPEFQYLNFATS
jgi:hypothetical protein